MSNISHVTLEVGKELLLNEVTSPGTPAATKAYIYLVDDGDSTTSLYVKFDDGTAVRLAGN